MSQTAPATNKAGKAKEKPFLKLDTEFFIKQGVEKKLAEKLADETEQNMILYADIDQKISELNAQKSMIQSTIKQYGKTEFINRYNKDKKRPVNFEIISADEKAKGLFILQDKYINIDNETADMLSAKYGDDIIDEQETFSIDKGMLLKYEKVIADFISNSKKIADEDRDKILVYSSSKSIKTGTIDNLVELSEKANKLNKKISTNIENVFNDIQPIAQFKL